MFILYLVKFYHEGDEHKTLVLLNGENGRRWTENPDYLDYIEKNHKEIISCDEVLTTSLHKFAFAIIDNEYMQAVKPLVGRYEVVQRYGGPEEGGWYYHTREWLDSTLTDLRPVLYHDLNPYGEGEIEKLEPVPGYHQMMNKQHYC